MSEPRFDLWLDPWIHVRDSTGGQHTIGLREALFGAHLWRELADPSPLVVVGVHRLLVAILQDALRPQRTADLVRLWHEERLPAEPLDEFAGQYADRFDLFSADHPFLQSADLGRTPGRGDKVKSVLYLYPEWPAGGETTHYRHGADGDAGLCAACAAAGLVTQPAFATSGGAGIKPSINGVPPLYVLPQGDSLARSLAASLVTADYFPKPADRERDDAWWRHAPTIGFKDEWQKVGYVHSLTFPARQVRLHPAPADGQPCTRCGAVGDWLVRTMVFNMGESRAKEAAFWQDPFAAYMPRRSGKGEPVPVRPQTGRALWRDYGALFLERAGVAEAGTLRPSVLAQIDAVAEAAGFSREDRMRVRCVGMRTDMKAKVFEWVDEGLEVPLSLLHSAEAAVEIEEGLAVAERIQTDLLLAWRQHIQIRRDRYRAERSRLLEAYWAGLAKPFDGFVLACATAVQESTPEAREDALNCARRQWTTATTRTALRVFEEATAALGDDAVALRNRVQGQAHCRALVIKHGKEYAPDAQ